MSLSKRMLQAIEGSSLIRKMFEEGAELIKTYGPDKVFDFSIGNPTFDPPPAVKQAIRDVAMSDESGVHRYMPNAGLPATRAKVARELAEETTLPFEANDIAMCVGAGGGLNVVFHVLCDPGDQILVPRPYFVEYGGYAANVGAELVTVATQQDFQLDLEAIEQAITPKTRIMLINSPNNPTGVVYSRSSLEALGHLIKRKATEYGTAITLVSDEPYKKIAFDDTVVPSPFTCAEETIVVTSHSKDLALPGERIGYIAISPQSKNRQLIQQALPTALRTLGFVNAPAFMQRVLQRLTRDALIDPKLYQVNRDLLWNHLTRLGFECVKPQGAFYLFPKSPIEDEMEFVRIAAKHRLLLVPGRGFGTPGYVRISYCFPKEKIEASLPVFTAIANEVF